MIYVPMSGLTVIPLCFERYCFFIRYSVYGALCQEKSRRFSFCSFDR